MKPTKDGIDEFKRETYEAVMHFRPAMLELDEVSKGHWATIENFVAVSLRVLAKTNASKIRNEALIVELSTLIPHELKKIPVGEATESDFGEFTASALR